MVKVRTGPEAAWTASGKCSLKPDAFRDCESVFELDAKISDSAVDPGMPKQQWDRAQVAGLPADQGDLRSPR